jgi:hypothetical protein
MALTRGFGGKLPCPICFVPKDKLADISMTWPLRTAANTQEIIKVARSLNGADRESSLSKYGLRDINVSLIDYFLTNYA